MHAVIFSGGMYHNSLLTQAALDSAHLILAADQGASTALNNNVLPHIVVGDFDSLPKDVADKLQKQGITLLPYPLEKDETDTELAVACALQKGATKITILGGSMGDRFDHVLANILLSVKSSVLLYFVDGNQTMWAVKGPATSTIQGKKSDLISLIPLCGDVKGIRTKNLYYVLNNETLVFGRPRGVSNVMTAQNAEVSCASGMLLIVHTTV